MSHISTNDLSLLLKWFITVLLVLLRHAITSCHSHYLLPHVPHSMLPFFYFPSLCQPPLPLLPLFHGSYTFAVYCILNIPSMLGPMHPSGAMCTHASFTRSHSSFPHPRPSILVYVSSHTHVEEDTVLPRHGGGYYDDDDDDYCMLMAMMMIMMR